MKHGQLLALALLLPAFAIAWPIHNLVRKNNVQQVRSAFQADPKLRFQINWQEGRSGPTALEIAIDLGNAEMVNLLKEYGALETTFESGSPAKDKNYRFRYLYDPELADANADSTEPCQAGFDATSGTPLETQTASDEGQIFEMDD